MASIQARHSRSCPLYPWTPFARSSKQYGCDCVPLYHVVLRHDGKLVREPVGHNRKEAERALDATRGDVARRKYRVLQDIGFDEWAQRWLAGFTGKANSKRSYSTTIDYATEVFGKSKVRDLDAGDVRRFLDRIRSSNTTRRGKSKNEAVKKSEVAPATLAKHLRQLGACLEAAVSEGYAHDNAVRKLHKTARPKVAKSRPTYYTDEELSRLWPELVDRPTYLALCKVAVATGMRIGELAALRWSDVDMLTGEVSITRSYTPGIGEEAPKSNEPRTVDLTPQARALFEAWFAMSGDDGLVFQHETGGHIGPSFTTRGVLYPALERAGIPRMGEHGRNRDFHSFRHSFARIALEHGAEITWVQRQLGHSSITLTVDTYGSWARSAEKAQAAKLAAAFPV